jgi:hypothetical protein
MNNTFEYETVELFKHPEKDAFIIDAPTFQAEVSDPINTLLKAVPNMLAEEDKGGWDTYGIVNMGTVIVFMVKKRTMKLQVVHGGIVR